MTKLDDAGRTGAGAFPATHWSLILAAGRPDSTKARQALGQLCEAYWYPVYAFIRRRGHDPEAAKDLTQELFARLIEYRRLKVADPDKGRFRCFLLACVQHFLNNERKKEQALKRGGHCSISSLDERLAEQRYGAEPADLRSPEKLFERRWALTLLDQALRQLRGEYLQAGNGPQFEVLQNFLSGAKGQSESYAQAGGKLGLSEAAARQAAYRMRNRYAELLRAEVAETVGSPAELEIELAHLRAVLSG